MYSCSHPRMFAQQSNSLFAILSSPTLVRSLLAHEPPLSPDPLLRVPSHTVYLRAKAFTLSHYHPRQVQRWCRLGARKPTVGCRSAVPESAVTMQSSPNIIESPTLNVCPEVLVTSVSDCSGVNAGAKKGFRRSPDALYVAYTSQRAPETR